MGAIAKTTNQSIHGLLNDISSNFHLPISWCVLVSRDPRWDHKIRP